MNNVILSGAYPEFCDALSERGYHIIRSQVIDSFISYEREHADMQCLIIDDTAFVLKSCERIANELSVCYHVILCDDPIDGVYPDHVKLNAAVVGNHVIARIQSLDHHVTEYCRKHGYTLLNVKQGYAKCSCVIVSDHAIITADSGIYHSLKEYKEIEVLKIEEGRVALPGADCGFIGGASGLHTAGGKRTLYFSGDISRHPDHDQIAAFCQKHDTAIISLTDDRLTDIGGMLFC